MTATAVIQPIDMIKVRIQLEGERGGNTNAMGVYRSIYKNEGVSALYKGLDSAILRQAV